MLPTCTSSCGLGHILRGFCGSLCYLGLGSGRSCSLLCCLGRFVLLLGSSDSLFALSFTNFRLHVPLCHNVSKRSTNNSTLVFLGTASSLLGGFFHNPLLVLPSVKDG